MQMHQAFNPVGVSLKCSDLNLCLPKGATHLVPKPLGLTWLNCQERLAKALKPWLEQTGSPPLLCLHGDETSLQSELIQAAIRHCSTTLKSVVAPSWLRSEELFGTQLASGEKGYLLQATEACLILPAQAVLRSRDYWGLLKRTLITKQWTGILPEAKQPFPATTPCAFQPKIVLLVDSEQASTLQSYDPHWTRLGIHIDIADTFLHQSVSEKIAQWQQYVWALKPHYHFSNAAWEILFRAAARKAQNTQRFSLDSHWLGQALDWAVEHDGTLALDRLSAALQGSPHLHDLEQAYWLEAVEQGLQHFDFSLSLVGQVNALSVVSSPSGGQFGLPERISCVLHSGESELQDIDTEVELGGRIHRKGQLILKGYLNQLLADESALPFSLSLVSEQVYDEFDGDSASLASVCAVLSACAQLPLNQAIAVTGSIDQFGRVQAVGGINEKIEGYFHCSESKVASRSKPCGVILPASNVKQLILSDQVLEAIEQNRFFLWPVSQVAQAMQVLTERAFDGPTSVLSRIRDAIRTFDRKQQRARRQKGLQDA